MNDALLRDLNRTNRATAVGNDIISATRTNSDEAPDINLVNASRTRVHKHHILCVDDEIISTTMRAEVLRQQGYSVDVYHCPLAALRCDLSVFELAILDFEMPELNGRELLLRLRASGARFPTVLLTGRLEALSYEDRVLFARCLDNGMPISQLLDLVAELLDLISTIGRERLSALSWTRW